MTELRIFIPGQEKPVLMPGPVTLVPALEAYYDINTDSFKLMFNGTPVGNVEIKAADYHEKAGALATQVYALVRELVDKHKARQAQAA